MNLWRVLRAFLSVVAVAGLAAAGWFTRPWWEPWLLPPKAETSGEAHAEPPGEAESVKLSPQARANLKLTTAPLELASWWKTLAVPGMVAERPGRSTRAVTTTLAGVVTKIAAIPGQSVKPGAPLFTIRLSSEWLQTAQAQLYKTIRDLEINGEEQTRLKSVADAPALFKNRLLELGYEERRLKAALDVHRQDLAARGLSATQIQQAEAGKFVTDIEVAAPKQDGDPNALSMIEDLKVQLGEPVQAGQALAYLGNHEELDIEGKAFEQEAAAILRAEREGWPVQVAFLDQSDAEWPTYVEPLKIRFVSAHVDPATRLLTFYLPLKNQRRDLKDSQGGVRQNWRFRPGQRVRLRVPLERIDNVLVVPKEAVVREGPNAYVFRANGAMLQRRPVVVLHEDQEVAVLANDGSVSPGMHLAQNAAAQINRALKSPSALPPGFHMHADGTIHANH